MSSVSISGPLISTSAVGSSTSFWVTSASDFGNVMFTPDFETLQSTSGPFTFVIEIHGFGIVMLVVCPLNIAPFIFPQVVSSKSGPSIDAFSSTPSILIFLYISCSSDKIFWV